MKIYRSVIYLPQFNLDHMGSHIHLTSPEPGLTSFSVGHFPHHVYLTVHASTGFSPLQPAVNTGVHRVSLALLYTSDHESWSARHYCDAIDKSRALPKRQAVLLMGIFRALWDHQVSS